MFLLMYRFFPGSKKIYRRGIAYDTKKGAQDAASAMRKHGAPARVVKSVKPVKYTVWMQEPYPRN